MRCFQRRAYRESLLNARQSPLGKSGNQKNRPGSGNTRTQVNHAPETPARNPLFIHAAQEMRFRLRVRLQRGTAEYTHKPMPAAALPGSYKEKIAPAASLMPSPYKNQRSLPYNFPLLSAGRPLAIHAAHRVARWLHPLQRFKNKRPSPSLPVKLPLCQRCIGSRAQSMADRRAKGRLRHPFRPSPPKKPEASAKGR